MTKPSKKKSKGSCSNQNILTEHDNESTINKLLNDDCLIYIFNLLPIIDRVKIERVCRRWKNVSNESWKLIRELNRNKSAWGIQLSTINRYDQTKILKKVLQRCGRFLTQIYLRGFQIEDSILCDVGELCSNLKILNTGFLKLTNSAIAALTLNCQNLNTLSIGPCTNECNDEHFSNLFSNCQNLKYFTLYNNPVLNGQCLLSLPRESIETIVIRFCPQILPENVFNAMKNFNKLHRLFITRAKTVPENREDRRMVTLPNSLQVLKIPKEFFNTIDLNAITSLTNLEELDVSKSDLIDDDFLNKIAQNCRYITELRMNGCSSISDTGIRKIARRCQIKVLSIQETNISDQSIKCMTSLKKLNCSRCENICDDGICTLLVCCDSLEELDLSYCPNITNRSITQAMIVAKCRLETAFLKINVKNTLVAHDLQKCAPSNLILIF